MQVITQLTTDNQSTHSWTLSLANDIIEHPSAALWLAVGDCAWSLWVMCLRKCFCVHLLVRKPSHTDTPISLIRSPSAGPIRDGRLIFQEADVFHAGREGRPWVLWDALLGWKGLVCFIPYHFHIWSEDVSEVNSQRMKVTMNSTMNSLSAATSSVSGTGSLQTSRSSLHQRKHAHEVLQLSAIFAFFAPDASIPPVAK